MNRQGAKLTHCGRKRGESFEGAIGQCLHCRALAWAQWQKFHGGLRGWNTVRPAVSLSLPLCLEYVRTAITWGWIAGIDLEELPAQVGNVRLNVHRSRLLKAHNPNSAFSSGERTADPFLSMSLHHRHRATTTAQLSFTQLIRAAGTCHAMPCRTSERASSSNLRPPVSASRWLGVSGKAVGAQVQL